MPWPLRSLFICYFSGIQPNVASQVSLLSTIGAERSDVQKLWWNQGVSSSSCAVCSCPGNPSQKHGSITWMADITQKAWLVPEALVLLYLGMQPLHLQRVLFWSVALNSKSCSPSHLGNDAGHLLSPFCPAPAVWRCCHAVFANNTNVSKWQNSSTHMRDSLMSSSPSLGSCAPRVMQEAYQQLSHQVKLSCREVGNPHPNQQTRLESWGCGRECSPWETESRKY